MRRELQDGFELDDDRGAARRRRDARLHQRRVLLGARPDPGAWCEHAIDGSARVVGLYRGAEQVGFARAVSDGVTVAYLADVYVLSEFRGRGLGLELVREILDGGRGGSVRWLLHTADAQGLYEKARLRSGRSRLPADGTYARARQIAFPTVSSDP